MREHFRRIGTRSFLLFMLQCGGLGLGYLLHLSLVKALGVTDYGKLSIIFSVSGVLGVLASFGLPTASMRFVSEYRHLNLVAPLRGLYWGGSVLTVGAALFLGSIVLAGLVVTDLFGVRLSTVELCIGLLLFLPVSNFAAWEFDWARAHQRVIVPGILQHLCGPLLLILSLMAFAVQKWTLSSVVVLLLMSVINLSFSLFLKHQTKEDGLQLRSVVPRFEWRYWLEIGSPMMLTGLFMAVMAQVDIFLLGWLRGADASGIYAVNIKIAGLVSLVITAVNALAAPVYAEMYAAQKKQVCQSLAEYLSLVIFFPSLVLAVGIGMSGKVILAFFGPDFVPSYPVLLTLIVGHLMNAASGSVGYLCDLTGLQKPAMYIRGVCALANLLLSFFFIRLWGLQGAAVSTAFCLVLWNLLLYILLRSRRNIRPAVWDGLFSRVR